MSCWPSRTSNLMLQQTGRANEVFSYTQSRELAGVSLCVEQWSCGRRVLEKGRPMIGRRGCWLLLAMLSVSVILAVVTHEERLPAIVGDFYRAASAAPKMVTVLVAPPLLLLFVVLLARWQCEVGGRARTGGELDRLLQCKRTGLLRRTAQRIRGRHVAATGRSRHVLQIPCSAPAEGMDRLVQKKHSGAWSPAPPRGLAHPSTEHGQAEA
jgi:hypothetical protein